MLILEVKVKHFGLLDYFEVKFGDKLNVIEVQHIEESQYDCNEVIYSAERFFNNVAENRELFAVLA